MPVRPGLSARQTHDYRRAGVTSLYAALEVASGEVINPPPFVWTKKAAGLPLLLMGRLMYGTPPRLA